jgi:HlyD family secretion protein
MTQNQPTPVPALTRKPLVIGLVSCFVLVFGVGGWAATTQLSGAVIAPGKLVVDTNVKKI